MSAAAELVIRTVETIKEYRTLFVFSKTTSHRKVACKVFRTQDYANSPFETRLERVQEPSGVPLPCDEQTQTVNLTPNIPGHL
jgi:hypothetical protein